VGVRNNLRFDWIVFFVLGSPPEIRQKKSAEQMENSSPNPSFSICDIRIQKQMSRSFGKSFPQKIVLPKLRPH
jgi:gamma-glutamylcysteine synthetase